MNVNRVKEYERVLTAEVSPDVYGGDQCNQVLPRWEAYADGDMQGETFTEPLELIASMYPAGTRVMVEQPCCPDCHQIAEMCAVDDGCSFDWDYWIECEYS